ncbi:tail assembly protein [Pseudomonas yamanorum]|nr:tail assembly protein [Pseudomonas yamanorum]
MHHEKVRTVRLYGTLGASFGRVHRLAVSNASEAIHALCILVPGFERFLMESKDKGVTYSIFLGRENIGQDRLKAPSGASDIRIAPVLMGSKRAGSMQTIIGVALIVAASYFSGGLAAAGGNTALIGGTSTAGWTFAANMGISMAMGGVMQLMSPQAKGLGTMDRPENRPSYSFNGPVNTSIQGSPVGLLYGQLTVGSAVISAGIHAQDQL